MKAKIKARYESPAMEVVQLQVKASLCSLSDQTIKFSFDDNNGNFIPDPEIGWRRNGYGDVDEII